jgi:hypothetical protein
MKSSILDEDQLEFVVELCQVDDDLVRDRFASTQCSNKNYTTTVHIDETVISDEPITAWFCTCTTRPSAVGCCAHITALIWHLAVCRADINHDEHELSANRFLLSIQDFLRYMDTEEGTDVTDGSTDTLSDYD